MPRFNSEYSESRYNDVISERRTRNPVKLIWRIRDLYKNGFLPVAFNLSDLREALLQHDVLQDNGQPFSNAYISAILSTYSVGPAAGNSYTTRLDVINPEIKRGKRYYFPSLIDRKYS